MDKSYKIKMSILDDQGVEKITGTVDSDTIKDSMRIGKIDGISFLYQSLLDEYDKINEKKFTVTTYSPLDFTPTHIETIFPDDMVQGIIKCCDKLEANTNGKYKLKKIIDTNTEKISFGISTNDNEKIEYTITVTKNN